MEGKRTDRDHRSTSRSDVLFNGAWQEGGKALKNEQEEGRESGGYRVGRAVTSTSTLDRSLNDKGVSSFSTSMLVLLVASIGPLSLLSRIAMTN